MTTFEKVTEQAAVVGRWVARIFGGLMVLIVLTFFIGVAWLSGGLGSLVGMFADEKLALLGFGLMIGGLAAAWVWEGVGGALTVAGYALDAILNRRAMASWPFVLVAATAALHLACWWRLRRRALPELRSSLAARRGLRFVSVTFGVLLLIGLVAFGVLLTRRSAEAPGEASVLVLEHANLIDGISDAPQRDVTVVVAEGKIKVVSAERISPPANAKRFDLSGRWLLPGFIDAHMHPFSMWPVGAWMTRNLLAIDGMTTGRSMFTDRYVDVELRERHRRGESDIPDILAAGYPVVPNLATFPIPFDMADIFKDQPQLKDLRGNADIGVAGARRLVRANLDHHVDVIKVFATNRAWFLKMDARGRALSNEQLVAAVAEARNAGIPVAAHAYGDDGVAAAVRAGVSSIEHGVYLTDATLELMKEKDVFFVPTIVAFPLRGQTKSKASGADAMAAREQDLAVSVRDSARRAHKMGVRVLAGTDGGRIRDEITELVGIGMTPMEAIQAATSRCAEALGISKRTGSIRPGLEADLIVLNGNPLQDIKAVRNVVLVVNDGRIAANRLRAK